MGKEVLKKKITKMRLTQHGTKTVHRISIEKEIEMKRKPNHFLKLIKQFQRWKGDNTDVGKGGNAADGF
jgi:hypothetical protein